MEHRSDMKFQHELVKGRIAETIFEEMFRETHRYTIFRFGYEMTHSMLAQYQHLAKRKDVIDQVRKNPDFVLINENKTEVYFIEVKYRRHVDAADIVKIAQELEVRWGISHVFVVSHDGFYYGNVHDLLRLNGSIARLSTSIVPEDIQQKYLQLLHGFLP